MKTYQGYKANGMTELESVAMGLQCKTCPNALCKDCKYFISEKNVRFCNRDMILSDALELLKIQIPRVMTIQEIIASSVPIWLETKTEGGNDWAFFVGYDNDHKIVSLNHIIGRVIANHSVTDYNKAWRCWTSQTNRIRRT